MPAASLQSIHEKLEIITDSVQITKMVDEVISRAKNVISICVDGKGFKSFGLESDYGLNNDATKKNNNYKIFEKLKTQYQDAKNKGVRIRYLTEISKVNHEHCNELMKFGEVRHIKGLVGNFIITEKEYLVGANSKDFFTQIIYSNKEEIVKQQNYIFENLWNNGGNQLKTTTLEKAKASKTQDIKILMDPVEIRHRYVNLIKSAKSEISIMIATPNALHRNYKGGIINMLRMAAEKKNVKVSLIVPAFEDHIYKETDKFTSIGLMPTIPNFEIKTIIPTLGQSNKIKTTFLLVDKKSSFIIDVKDDSKENFLEAVGFAIYSNSESHTESYNFIFDTIWKQADLHESLLVANENLKEAYEKLKNHDAMEKEFINIAAHELRTPSQSIIGYAEMLKYFPERNQEYLDPLLRNAERLFLLVTDMLDVARIESQTLKLHKTDFDLNLKIKNVIKDLSQQNIRSHKDVNIVFKPSHKISVHADKGRIFQVISNLLNNALKFTNEGLITIGTKKKDKTNQVIISFTDSGIGIDPEIIPHLFSKFKSNSDSGLGLGLFIAKGIVEAHGGKIDAYNNTNGKGVTFNVNLPLRTNF